MYRHSLILRFFFLEASVPEHREVYSRSGLELFLMSIGLRADFLTSPLLNGALNAMSSLTNINSDRRLTLSQRTGATVETVSALAASPFLRRSAPELVVLCSVVA